MTSVAAAGSGAFLAAMLLPAAAAWAGPAPGPRGLTADAASLVHRVAVFGKDDRTPLPARKRALERSIGILYETRTHTVCSAFCVGDDTIATASHCIYRTSGERPPRIAGFSFRLTGKSSHIAARVAGGGSGGAGQFVAAGTTSLRIQPPIDASRDWALMRLDRPVCKGAALPVRQKSAAELAGLSKTRAIYQVAFHRDFVGWRLAYGGPCSIRERGSEADWKTVARDFSDADRLILHLCDTGGASSGSPLLADGPGGPEVIGINVGTYVRSRVLMQRGEVLHRYKAETVANTGVNAASFGERLTQFLKADILASREKIREVQKLLGERRLYAGAADGAFGPKLRSAIEAFERGEGRPPSGLATSDLLRRLSAPNAEATTRIETGTVSSHRTSGAQDAIPAR